jgi:hypothetical protein
MAAHLRWSCGRRSLPVWGTLVLVCACALPLVSDQRGQAQVVVVSVSGDWTPMRQDLSAQAHSGADNAQHPVRFGETITVGPICLFGNEGDAIVLMQNAPKDNVLHSYPCEKAKPDKAQSCPVKPLGTSSACAVDLRTVGQGQGLVSAFVATISDAFTRLTQSQPEKYMVAASRGAEAELADAVVPLQGGQIDLRAVFRNMDPGTYNVKFASVEAQTLSGPAPQVTYAKGQAVLLQTPAEVRAGLYKLSLVSQSGEPGDSDCWVLVATPPEYARQSAAFERAVSESAKLPGEMDAGATRALLRAYLESLASPKQGATRP